MPGPFNKSTFQSPIIFQWMELYLSIYMWICPLEKCSKPSYLPFHWCSGSLHGHRYWIWLTGELTAITPRVILAQCFLRCPRVSFLILFQYVSSVSVKWQHVINSREYPALSKAQGLSTFFYRLFLIEVQRLYWHRYTIYETDKRANSGILQIS